MSTTNFRGTQPKLAWLSSSESLAQGNSNGTKLVHLDALQLKLQTFAASVAVSCSLGSYCLVLWASLQSKFAAVPPKTTPFREVSLATDNFDCPEDPLNSRRDSV